MNLFSEKLLPTTNNEKKKKYKKLTMRKRL